MILVVAGYASPAAAVREPTPNYHTLSRGSRGENVRALQYLLRSHGHSISIDGAFGGGTDSIVKDFQGDEGLTRDGIVGPGTWGKLVDGKTARQGNRGSHVTAMTRLLRKWDGKKVTTTFDAALKTRVKAFQRHWNLTDDGIVGANTWKRLVFQYEQPSLSSSLCTGLTNGRDTNDWANDSWGTAETVGALERTAVVVRRLARRPKTAVRDLSKEKGGDIDDHGSHEHGMDIDIRPYAISQDASFQCNNPLTHNQSNDLAAGESLLNSHKYNWWRTAYSIQEFRNTSISLGRDLHKITFFQDHRVINSVPEVQWLKNHHNHTHVRSCTRYYPANGSYQCTNNNTNL